MADPEHIYQYAYWRKREPALPGYLIVIVLNEKFDWVVRQQVKEENVRPISRKELFLIALKDNSKIDKIKGAIA